MDVDIHRSLAWRRVWIHWSIKGETEVQGSQGWSGSYGVVVDHMWDAELSAISRLGPVSGKHTVDGC